MGWLRSVGVAEHGWRVLVGGRNGTGEDVQGSEYGHQGEGWMDGKAVGCQAIHQRFHRWFDGMQSLELSC
jgi:hypothetical protein